MADIVLATLNAKFIHAAFGLRYLYANLGDLRRRCRLLEFDLTRRPIDIAEDILSENPRIIGLGVYIWNVGLSTELVLLLKRLRPEVFIVLGGPEVSFEIDHQPICRAADYIVTGEADLVFRQLCGSLLSSDRPEEKVLVATPPPMKDVVLPYEYYTEKDIAHRIIYVEASRGCPFSCEFCLSSLEIPVRQVDTPQFLDAINRLLNRGVKHLKFVDRTFNLSLQTSKSILEFLLQRYQPGHLFHFEMIPDRLPDSLREVISRFPPGALQFEVGIQTFNPETAARISRRQDYARLKENLMFLRHHTGVHVHADLIFGLPGEGLESFANGFDELVRLNPQEIQVGILKRLRGTPIVRHDQEWGMIYSPLPPYEILENKCLSFGTVQRMRRFARYWDIVANSGNFPETTTVLLGQARNGKSEPALASSFDVFMHFSDWLYRHAGRTDSIALVRTMEFLFVYLTEERCMDPLQAAGVLWNDYRRTGRRDKPSFLKDFLPIGSDAPHSNPESLRSAKRQARHLASMPPMPSGIALPGGATQPPLA